jgi:glycine/D-amino acid oxidase-like deaminating enzyme
MVNSITRREAGFLMSAGIAQGQSGPRVTVVGAGAFGGWTALHLLRAGARVTLVDGYGPGNSRASSGGETRITRAAYEDRVYADLTLRALEIWKESERKWNRKIFTPCGVVRLEGKASTGAAKLLKVLKDSGAPHRHLTAAEATKQFPQFDFTRVESVIWEPKHGLLRARQGCQAVREAFEAEGGKFEQRALKPGDRVEADAVVWACGPWLGKLFPGLVPVKPTRQEVFFFGTPPGETIYDEQHMPCFIDDAEPDAHYYGTPGNDFRGLKLGDDAYGPDFDPDRGERRFTESMCAKIRAYLKFRFPKMAEAPLVETRVCQYEVSPDAHLILDKHPSEAKYWIAGGGSGHGYKLGAAVGERLSEMVLGKRAIDPFFSLARFKK